MAKLEQKEEYIVLLDTDDRSTSSRFGHGVFVLEVSVPQKHGG
jgi:hypothetical protein